jgi:hypothetical protein
MRSSAPTRWWFAATLLAATCATAGAAAYAGRGWLEDSWWMWKLGSEDRDWRPASPLVRALRRMGRQALPALERCREYYAHDSRIRRILDRVLFMTERALPL